VTRRTGCPGAVELERAYWSKDAAAQLHVETCSRCAGEWAEIAALVDVGRAATPAPPSPRREEIRTTLLASRGAPAPERPRRWAWQLAAPAAALAAIVWWAWPAPEPGPERRAARGHLLAHDGARYMIASGPPEEIVRLVEGTLTVEVDPLRSGERFRVVTGDAEVEVRGTAFDVSAAGDRLRSVRVIHGAVEVRPAGGTALMLGAGQSWDATALGPRTDAGQAATAAADDAVAAADAFAADAAAPPGPGGTAAGTAGGGRSRPAREPRARIQTDAGRVPTAPSRPAGQRAFDDGWSAIRDGDFDGAADAFARAAAAGGGSMAEDARYWRAVALARAGKATLAAEAFAAFVDAHPSSSRAGEASVMLGWLLFDRGDYPGAARRFRAAVEDRSSRVRESAARGLEAVRRAEE
jgi:TolA-binding protein